ncbi:hypothetical protein PAPYR_9775 [Paratrimastix pyriformis]|uniref:Calpain catalytic domain-containing protein n=1 Tax=Paratrimastix pyriformis TaxID=342808 RepID=A0ABQ8UEQ1_9EUKA|nr:hypothetical protein PAPYR_9775 [Paratrimastix pyriformis]
MSSELLQTLQQYFEFQLWKAKMISSMDLRSYASLIVELERGLNRKELNEKWDSVVATLWARRLSRPSVSVGHCFLAVADLHMNINPSARITESLPSGMMDVLTNPALYGITPARYAVGFMGQMAQYLELSMLELAMCSGWGRTPTRARWVEALASASSGSLEAVAAQVRSLEAALAPEALGPHWTGQARVRWAAKLAEGSPSARAVCGHLLELEEVRRDAPGKRRWDAWGPRCRPSSFPFRLAGPLDGGGAIPISFCFAGRGCGQAIQPRVMSPAWRHGRRALWLETLVGFIEGQPPDPAQAAQAAPMSGPGAQLDPPPHGAATSPPPPPPPPPGPAQVPTPVPPLKTPVAGRGASLQPPQPPQSPPRVPLTRQHSISGSHGRPAVPAPAQPAQLMPQPRALGRQLSFKRDPPPQAAALLRYPSGSSSGVTTVAPSDPSARAHMGLGPPARQQRLTAFDELLLPFDEASDPLGTAWEAHAQCEPFLDPGAAPEPDGAMFCDPTFPATLESILDPSPDAVPLEVVGRLGPWRRPGELSRRPVFASDQLSVPVQGQLVRPALAAPAPQPPRAVPPATHSPPWGPGGAAQGNCWFVSGLHIILSRHPEILLALLQRADPTHGIYQFRFFKNSQWVLVTIDDRLPCDEAGELVFSRCSDGAQFWCPLIEKAYAKVSPHPLPVFLGAASLGVLPTVAEGDVVL